MTRSQRFERLGAAWLLAALSLALAHPAQAEDASATAQALFDEAKALMKAGSYETACPKLEQSQKLDPGLGTLFNLADCNEKTGRIATAWTRFVEVASGAHSSGHVDAEKVARERADKLMQRLPKLVVEVGGPQSTPGLEVQRNGITIGPALWGLAIPVDPGAYRLTARAPGRRAWEATIDAREAEVAKVTVPVLATEPAAAPPARASESPPATQSEKLAARAEPSHADQQTDHGTRGSSQRTIGLVVGGAGVAGIAASVVLGALAKSQYDGANCPQNVCATASDGGERDAADRKATAATIVFAAGAAALAGGAALYLFAPQASERASAGPTLILGLTGTGLVVRGRL